MEEIEEAVTNQPTVVIKLSSHLSEEAIIWLINRLSDDKLENGCQLYVAQHGELLFVSASATRFLLGAEVCGLKKEYKDGSIREFCFADSTNFPRYNDDDFLMESECHQIIKFELDGLRAVNEDSIPGHPSIPLYPGKSIFRRLQKYELVTDCFPFHNRHAMASLKQMWYRRKTLAFLQPVNAINEYYGNTIALYFAFLNFYTIGLIPLIILGLASTLFRQIMELEMDILMAILTTCWSTILLELWKRHSNEYMYKWGCLDPNVWEEPRSGFHGVVGVNPISNKKEPMYPVWKRILRVWIISNPIIVLCLGLSISLMFYYFRWEIHYMKLYKEDDIISSIMKNVPSIVYSIFIIIADTLYRYLAIYLTEQENHRLESAYQHHLIFKILLLAFTNNFLVLFYIAFVYDDLAMLRMTLQNLFLVHMFVSQTFESLVPYWQFKARSYDYRFQLSTSRGFNKSRMFETAKLSREQQARIELERHVYPGTFDDYIELWLQFGYVSLFSLVYPAAAFFAFLNNLIEERADAFKMCCVYRRPFPVDTGVVTAWKIAFQMLSYLAVVSNLVLLFRMESFNNFLRRTYPDITNAQILALFFICEHFLLLARWVVSMGVKDIPGWISTELAKIKYWSIEALKRQRSLVLRTSEKMLFPNDAAVM